MGLVSSHIKVTDTRKGNGNKVSRVEEVTPNRPGKCSVKKKKNLRPLEMKPYKLYQISQKKKICRTKMQIKIERDRENERDLDG